MGIPFRVVSSRYQERWSRRKKPEDLSIRHALGKIHQAVLPAKARLVLGGDTIVWHEGHGLGKPRTRPEAIRMVRRLAGTKHAVYTGLALWDRKTGHVLTGYDKTDVWIKKLSEAELCRYVDSIHPYDKAGAYAIQLGPKIVRRIRGSYSNVVGFPRELFRKMLKQMLQKADAHGSDEGHGLKNTILFLCVALFVSFYFPVHLTASIKGEDGAEDYQLLKEIIVTEFSSETPHEWGESVSGVKTRLKTEEKVVAIGLDADAMAAGEEMPLLKFFQKENIPVTLFASGAWIDRHEAFLKKLAVNPLFEIANHGLEQKPCSINGNSAQGKQGTRNVEEVFAEIEKNARKIEAITGVLPQYYHAGAGYYDEVAVRIIKALGYEAVGSDIRLPEGAGVTQRQVFDALANPAMGAITVLRSAELDKTLSEGIMESIRRLRAKGYKFVKLSEYPLA